MVPYRLPGADALPLLRPGRGGRAAEGGLRRADRAAAPADTQDHVGRAPPANGRVLRHAARLRG